MTEGVALDFQDHCCTLVVKHLYELERQTQKDLLILCKGNFTVSRVTTKDSGKELDG